MKKNTSLDYKPTYKDLFSLGCVGWAVLFVGQMLTIISYLAVLGQNRWSYNQDDLQITVCGLFGCKGDGDTVYYYNGECASLLGSGSTCNYLKESGLAVFLLLLFTLLFSIVHAGILSTYRLGNAMWYKRYMLVAFTIYQGVVMTLMAVWWSLDQYPLLKKSLPIGVWRYDKSHYYAWLYPGFIYFVLLPFSFIVAFDAEPAPGEEGVGLISGQASKVPSDSHSGPVEIGGKWYSHKGPAAPPFAPPKLPTSDEESGYLVLQTSSSAPSSPSPVEETSSAGPARRPMMPMAAPAGVKGGPAPARPPPPKSQPKIKKWRKEYDDNYKEYYYVNIKTGESQWEKPADYTDE